jgi:precorrin-2 dehydrogenase / sirohydrochlorin ferrochelatase
MNYYPIFLDLRGRPCLVVGGGEVATGKIEELLKAEANVTVISPKVTQCIQRYADLGGLRHLPRPYRAGDIKGYFLAYAATGVAEIDVLMAGEASLQGVLLNVINRPVLCSFVTPAVSQRDKLSIGKCPGFAKRVRRKITAFIHPEHGNVLTRVAAQRQELMRERFKKDEAGRRRLLELILESEWKKLHPRQS